MCKALVSIKPEFVTSILSGEKKYEYRKIRFRQDVDSILIYSTSPVMKVVAEVKITGIIEGSPEEVWKKTENGSGIDKSFYDVYYNDKDYAIALCLGRVKIFKKAKPLSSYNIKTPPQSFSYINLK